MELGARVSYCITEEARDKLKEATKLFGLSQFEALSIILEEADLKKMMKRAKEVKEEKLKEREQKKQLRKKLRSADSEELTKALKILLKRDGQ